MIIGEAGAVTELWDAARDRLPPAARGSARTSPSTRSTSRRPPGETGLRAATPRRPRRGSSRPAPPRTELELGIDPLARDADGFRWRTAAQIDEGRSWLWLEDGVVRFKAEASAWTPQAVQIQQVWVDPEARGRGYGARGLRDLCRLLLAQTPTVTLFVRSENAPAIALYESIGMRRCSSTGACSSEAAAAARARRLDRPLGPARAGLPPGRRLPAGPRRGIGHPAGWMPGPD